MDENLKIQDSMEKLDLDLEGNLKHYVPDIFSLMGNEEISWSSITRNFEKQYEARRIEHEKSGGYLMVEPSFYDLVTEVFIHKNPEATRLFTYIKGLFKRLNENLTIEEKRMISKIVRNLLKNLKRNYLHSVGELLVLDNFILSKKYKLRGVESELENGKRIDFKFFSLIGNRELLIEVMNIELRNDKLTSYESIDKYFGNKFLDKVNDKTANLDSPIKFLIIPFLWGSAEQLDIISRCYKNGLGVKYRPIGVSEPFSFTSVVRKNGDQLYNFAKISYLFDVI